MGPNHGDGNRDGIRDAVQDDVTSLRASSGGSFVTVDAMGHTLTNVRAIATPSQTTLAQQGLENVNLPYGMFGFEVHGVQPGGAAEVKLFLPEGFNSNSYYKQDSTGALQHFDFDGTTGALFNGNVVTLHVVDGGRGDADGVANGTILDPGGPGDPPGGGGGGSGGPPTATDDNYAAMHDRPLVVYPDGLRANDITSAGTEPIVVLVSGPLHGSVDYAAGDVSLPGIGAFQYTPASLYVGTDSFTYKLVDGDYESNVATVTIDVTNAAPTASPDNYSITEDQRLTVYAYQAPIAPDGSGLGDATPFSAGMLKVGPEGGWYGVSNNHPLLENDADSDLDVLRAVLLTDVSHGKLAPYDDGSFVYTPDSNFVGGDTFTYTATDGIADSSPTIATIHVTAGANLDLDGRDITTGSRWMTEGEEQAYGLGVSTTSTGDILARAPRPPSTGSGWQLTTREIHFDPTTLAVGGGSGSPNGVINLLGSSGDVILGVSALHDITDPSARWLSSVTYLSGWFNPNLGMGTQELVTMEVGPKVVFETIDVTTDHGVLLDNAVDPLSTKDAKRFPNVEVDFAKGYTAAFSQTIGTQLKETITYSTSGFPAGATLAGQTEKRANPAGFPWLSATFTLQTKVNGAAVQVSLGNISTNEIGNFRIDTHYRGVITFADNSTGATGWTDVDYIPFLTYGTPKNPANVDELKPTWIRMSIASPVLKKAFAEAVTRRAAIAPPQTGIPKPEQIVLETLRQHVFALNNPIVGNLGWAAAWKVPYYWTNKYRVKVLNPANYVVGGDCFSGAVFTVFADNIFGVSDTIEHKEYASKSIAQSTTAVEWSTVKGDDYRESPKNRPFNGQNVAQMLGMWDSGNNFNFLEATVVWSDPTKTYYFPSGMQQNTKVFSNKDDVLSVFESFGYGVLIVDRTTASGSRAQIIPNPQGQQDVNQFKTFNLPRPTGLNLYQ
jgi:hypothetical protein